MESEKSMTQKYDSVFLIGFGGPTKGCCRRYEECPGEAFCYVENIVGNRSGGRDRIEEVSEHYKHFNGVSPFVFFSQNRIKVFVKTPILKSHNKIFWFANIHG